MKLSTKARTIHSQVHKDGTKLGDLRKLAKEIKKDHALAMELWSTGAFYSRQLAILIMDKKLLTGDLVDQLTGDMERHDFEERTQLADWLLANQLAKSKATVALLESWSDSSSAIQRRLFWYYQARLRWTGQTPPDNTEDLLSSIEERIIDAEPEVQWAMNFTAAQIGIFDEAFRSRCVTLGEKTGLYKGEAVARGCTPNYLPDFIAIEVEKRGKR